MARTPPLNPLRVFESAARCGSFKAAAAELCVTEGAISRQIKVLEQYLGVRLFHRGGGQTGLTEAGDRLFPPARDALAQLRRAVEELVEQNKVLHLQTGTSFALRWLMPRLAGFELEHPEIKLSLQTASGDLRIQQWAHLDASIVYLLDAPRGDHRLHHIVDEYLVPVCSPASLDGRAYLSMQDLAQQRLLFNDPTGRDWRRWSSVTGVPQLRWNHAMRFDSDDAAIQAAVAHHGIALSNLIFITEEIKRGTLVPATDIAPIVIGAHYLYLAPERENEPSVETFLNWVKTRTREQHRRMGIV